MKLSVIRNMVIKIIPVLLFKNNIFSRKSYISTFDCLRCWEVHIASSVTEPESPANLKLTVSLWLFTYRAWSSGRVGTNQEGGNSRKEMDIETG